MDFLAFASASIQAVLMVFGAVMAKVSTTLRRLFDEFLVLQLRRAGCVDKNQLSRQASDASMAGRHAFAG